MYLHGNVGGVYGEFACEEFRRRRGLCGWTTGVLERRRPVDQRAGRADASFEVGELERNGLVAGDRLPEGAALVSPVDRVIQAALSQADAHRRDTYSAAIERAQEDARATAALAEHRVVWNPTILKR